MCGFGLKSPKKYLFFGSSLNELLYLKKTCCQVPTIAFHASLNHPFGKGALINLFRQLAKVMLLFTGTFGHFISVFFSHRPHHLEIIQVHTAAKQISVGFIGYPNTGNPFQSTVFIIYHRIINLRKELGHQRLEI